QAHRHTHRDFPVQSGKNVNNATLENDNKLLTNNMDRRASYDGHNWRKYGQKLVKGSEFPRSYYKCTHTNCPVKKKVEKTLDGKIAEIVYKGEHNHPKPQPHPQPQPLDYNYDPDTRNEVKNPNQQENENNIESSGQSNYSVFVAASSNSSLALSGDCEEVSESLEVDFKSKRTKRENQLSKESTVERGSSEPRIVVEKNNVSETTGDGFRWRKYGQKVVKGKIYPRSYYRCTSPKCNVRKYVERMSEDPTSFISTYEGKHNHNSTTNAETSKNARAKNRNG
ncbi:probable WRKY transcription factor 3, partial [Phtheirospermum japonicum]